MKAGCDRIHVCRGLVHAADLQGQGPPIGQMI